MNLTRDYKPQFERMIREQRINPDAFPEQIRNVIDSFEKVKDVWNKSDLEQKSMYLESLIRSDVLICYLLNKDKSQKIKTIPNARLEALKQKALDLKAKWGKKN